MPNCALHPTLCDLTGVPYCVCLSNYQIQAANLGITALHAPLVQSHLGVVRLFMEGPLRSVAAAENVCPPTLPLHLEPRATGFLDALCALNKKDDLLACVLYECDILPWCLEECFGWCD